MPTTSRKPPARRAAKPALTFAAVRAKIQRPRQIVDMVLDAEAAEASRVRFTLEAITHRAYQQLRAEHPPTKEQIEAAAGRGGSEDPAFDPDAFAPALVKAQLVEPKPETPEEFAAFWDDLSDGQLGQLWQAAISVQFQTGELGPPSQAAADILRSFGMATG